MPSSLKLLLIEDDKTIGGYICDGLREKGHSVDLFTSGSEGLIQASIGQYDGMIVDRMLPSIDGISLLKTLRGTKITRLFCS